MIYKKEYALKFYREIIKKNGILIGFIVFLKLIASFIIRNIKWCFYKLFYHKFIKIKVSKSELFLPMKNTGLDLSESSISKQLVLSKIREVESTKILRDIIKPGDVIVELGANIGYFVIIEAEKMQGKGKIIAIEPEPTNFEFLKKNISINKLSNLVHVNNLAISDHDGFVKLNISKEANCHTLFNPENKKLIKSIQVESKTLDSFLESTKSPVNLIRMDIEGAESIVIGGMKKTLSKNKNLKLFIEIHPHLFKERPNPIVKMLEDLKKHGFETAYVISYDKYYRRLINMQKVEKMSINQLIQDRRVREGEIGFQVFFEKQRGIKK